MNLTRLSKALFQPRFTEWHLDKGDIENTTYLEGFHSEIEKISARAGLKIIRKLVQAGGSSNLARADRLAGTTGVLKETPLGHYVKTLGRGSEGIADVVAGGVGKKGLKVRKLYDPNSPLASPEMIKRKVELGKAVKHPALAETYGRTTTPGGGQATFHEWMQPTQASVRGPGYGAELRANLGKPHVTSPIQSLKDAAKAKGFNLADLRPDNIVGGKVIDPMVFKPGEFRGMMGGMMNVTPKGMRVLGQGTKRGTKDIEKIRALMGPTRTGALPPAKWAPQMPWQPGIGAQLALGYGVPAALAGGALYGAHKLEQYGKKKGAPQRKAWAKKGRETRLRNQQKREAAAAAPKQKAAHVLKPFRFLAAG